MAGEGTQTRPTIQDRPPNDRLDSWKEIAAYLKREVRTVQRWEKSLGLPVRRLAHGKQGTVFAHKADLNAWWQESQSKLDVEENDDPRRASTLNVRRSVVALSTAALLVVLASVAYLCLASAGTGESVPSLR